MSKRCQTLVTCLITAFLSGSSPVTPTYQRNRLNTVKRSSQAVFVCFNRVTSWHSVALSDTVFGCQKDVRLFRSSVEISHTVFKNFFLFAGSYS